jgi:hypothetical protein
MLVRTNLVTGLITGLDPSGQDSNNHVSYYDEKKSMNEEYTTQDYRIAPEGKGPLASQWADKPHRLVYDLVKNLDKANEENKRLRATLLRIANSLEDEMDGLDYEEVFSKAQDLAWKVLEQ